MKTFNKLKFRLLLLMSLIIVLFSLFLFIYIRATVQKDIKNKIYDSVLANQEEVDTSFKSIIDEVTSTYVTIINDDDFIDMVTNDQYDEYINIMSNIPINEGVISKILLWNDNQFYSKEKNNIILNDSYFIETIIERPSGKNIVFGGVCSDIYNNKYLLFGKKIYSYSLLTDACLIFCIEEDLFSKYLNSITGDLGYSLLLKDNIILSHKDDNYVGSIATSNENEDIVIINDREMLVLKSKLRQVKEQYNFEWNIISYIDYNQMFLGVNKFILYDSVIITLFVIIGIIIALIISSWLVTPIKKLITKLHDFSKTGISNKENKLYSDDISELDRVIDEMMIRISNLIEVNNIEQENKRELELYALQVQINPHFLYNTLDAIAWLAKLKKQPEIEKLVLALAQFFRISLHKGDKIITVEEEIELIKNYCIIELTKVPDQFSIEYKIDDDVKKLNTMKLILQPIVENAIKHGIANREDAGNIIVKAYKVDNYIFYEVIDDGEGFEVPKDMFVHNEEKITYGYGLKNVDERIKLEYGKDCGITIESSPGNGTKVIVKFLNR